MAALSDAARDTPPSSQNPMAALSETPLAAFDVEPDGSPLPATVAEALKRDGAVVLRLADGDGALAAYLDDVERRYRDWFARPEGAKERDVARAAAASYYAADRREWVHAASPDVAAVPGVGAGTKALFKLCRSLALRVLRCCAPGLESVKRRDTSVLDAFSYRPCEADEPQSMGRHTDPGLFTVAAATHPGLEVAAGGGTFRAADARAYGRTAFVVLAGDALEARSRGAFAATVHRVAPHRGRDRRLAFIFELRRDDEDRDFME